MKLYLKSFKLFFLLLLAALIATICVAVYRSSNPKKEIVRTNSECLTEERVFDYADLLSDAQENALRDYISSCEKKTSCDIVLVTLNENIGTDWNSVRDWADDFYDQNKFGYNKPCGDGVLLLDNWYSFGDYKGDTWLSTCGKAESAYSSSDIDSLLDDVCENVNENPYEAYHTYVKLVTDHMKPTTEKLRIPWPLLLGISLIISGFYFVINYFHADAKDTTTAMTYVAAAGPEIEKRTDTFVTKTVHKRKIETDSGGGGGGHHISSGGISHGGGGHHH
ncbi:MAG: TPM domain-containing protein [Lachnospiraceae bacterium]|nr:TPM domain-containing protein [Lachnospiraceae bacterium]